MSKRYQGFLAEGILDDLAAMLPKDKATGKMVCMTVLIEGVTPLVVHRFGPWRFRVTCAMTREQKQKARAVSEWNKRWHREYMQRQKKATR